MTRATMGYLRCNGRRVLMLVGCLLTCGCLLAHAQAPSGDIAIVVHPNVPVANVSFEELRRLVLGDKQYWSGNLPVTLLLRAPVARERDVVLQKVYEMTEAQFRQYWIKKVFRAETSAGPKIVYSNDMAIGLLSMVPGAITFMNSTDVPKNLKVLQIDGKLPGQTGYPLR